jgi:hypothetical protein
MSLPVQVCEGKQPKNNARKKRKKMDAAESDDDESDDDEKVLPFFLSLFLSLFLHLFLSFFLWFFLLVDWHKKRTWPRLSLTATMTMTKATTTRRCFLSFFPCFFLSRLRVFIPILVLTSNDRIPRVKVVIIKRLPKGRELQHDLQT